MENLLSKFNIVPDSPEESSFSAYLSDYFHRLKTKPSKEAFIETGYQKRLLQDLLYSFEFSDFCLVGTRGCGKSILISQLADMLGKRIEHIVLYQDMTSRDLIQQRATLDNGDTVWRFSPLINAAIDGKIAVLDGIHRIHPSTFTVLHR